MNAQIKGLKTAGAVFGLVAVLQLIRLLASWEVIINHREIPLWFSGLAVVVMAALSLWMLRLSRWQA